MPIRLAVLCLIAVLSQAFAQEDFPSGGRSGRGGNIREFLGLGAAPDRDAAARGEKLYTANCAFCHGEKARGAEGPNLVRSTIVLRDEKGELIAPVVTKGVPDKGMPPFPSFAEGQLFDIAQYLHLQVELVANRGLYKRLNVVTGNPKAGQAYFAANCSSCHSPTGDLEHIAARYASDQLQNRFVWPGLPRARKVTVTPPSGTPVSGTLKRIDDFDISLVDGAGVFHAWPRDAVKVEIEDRLGAHRSLLEKYTDQDIHNLTAYLVTLK